MGANRFGASSSCQVPHFDRAIAAPAGATPHRRQPGGQLHNPPTARWQCRTPRSAYPEYSNLASTGENATANTSLVWPRSVNSGAGGAVIAGSEKRCEFDMSILFVYIARVVDGLVLVRSRIAVAS